MGKYSLWLKQMEVLIFVQKVVDSLSDDLIEVLIKFVVQWNSNSRTAQVSITRAVTKNLSLLYF